MQKPIKLTLALISCLFILNGCNNKSNLFRASYSDVCANYVIDVMQSDFREGRGNSFTVAGPIGKWGFQDGSATIGGQTARMHLQFLVKRLYSQGRPWPVHGEGRVTNFDVNFGGTVGGVQAPVNYQHEAYRPGSALSLVRSAVRNGLENLQEAMQSQYEPWRGIVSDVSMDGREITIETTPGDNLRQGDVFRIFPIGPANNIAGGGGFNNNYNTNFSVYNPSCQGLRRNPNQPALAMARLTSLEEFSSTLEVVSRQSQSNFQQQQRMIQIGDLVESSRSYDSDEDRQRRQMARKVVKLGSVRPAYIYFQPRQSSQYYYINRPVDITSFISTALLTEGPNFGFEFIQ